MNGLERFRFDPVSGRYYAKSENPPTFVFDRDDEKIPNLNPSQAFDVENDEIPF